MKKKIAIELEVPDGATHYLENSSGKKVFFKWTEREDGEAWMYWCPVRESWFIEKRGSAKPYGIKELKFVQ